MFFAFYLPLLSFVLVTLVLLVYIFWPFTHYNIPFPEVSNSAHQPHSVTVISHGLKDSNRGWAKQLESHLKQHDKHELIVNIDWEDYADNALTCSVNGRRIGTKIAEKLTQIDQLTSVKVIGHSCGGFINLGLCEGLKSANEQVKVKSVYLAPVSVYGGIFWNYGTQNFGRCADESITYYDREDKVPGSNKVPVYSEGVDITQLKESFGYQGPSHQWPIYYFLALVSRKE
ncbi:hypothetical protein [Thalassotalea hakodatensis]|uniref:hypothetical protein n=1 Tax=Thalassotalea hakodatensis TaxID=3030492 RepID=UPI0025746A68|nr:hypothetical protein [Thalassotalea hakodatensis]